jgi:hypothetical protein
MEEIAYYVRLCVKNEAAKQDLDQFIRERQLADENMPAHGSLLQSSAAWLIALIRRPLKKAARTL